MVRLQFADGRVVRFDAGVRNYRSLEALVTNDTSGGADDTHLDG